MEVLGQFADNTISVAYFIKESSIEFICNSKDNKTYNLKATINIDVYKSLTVSVIKDIYKLAKESMKTGNLGTIDFSLSKEFAGDAEK